MTETEQKERFVIGLLKNPDDPFKVALEIFPNETNKALRAAHEWPRDPEVIAIKDKILKEDGEVSVLPSKADLARKVWNLANSESICTEDKIKAMKLYADVRGFIDKPNQGTTVNVTQNRVMVVKDLGTNDEWEAKAAKQQRELLNVSTSKH